MVLAVIEVDEDEDICVNQVNGRKIKDVWIWEEDGGYEYLQKIEEVRPICSRLRVFVCLSKGYFLGMCICFPYYLFF
jgi:hypothetical protein